MSRGAHLTVGVGYSVMKGRVMKYCFVCESNYRGQFIIHQGTKKHQHNQFMMTYFGRRVIRPRRKR